MAELVRNTSRATLLWTSKVCFFWTRVQELVQELVQVVVLELSSWLQAWRGLQAPTTYVIMYVVGGPGTGSIWQLSRR